MHKVVLTIIGRDCPGIIYKVSKVLTIHNCNILEVSQTTLLGEFAGLFSTEVLEKPILEKIKKDLTKEFENTGLGFWIKEFSEEDTLGVNNFPEAEPYVISVRGEDKKGLVPEFSGTMAGFDVNVDNFRAVLLSDLKVALVFEVSVPKAVNQVAFREALALKAEELNMDVSVQHRDIFEAIHRL